MRMIASQYRHFITIVFMFVMYSYAIESDAQTDIKSEASQDKILVTFERKNVSLPRVARYHRGYGPRSRYNVLSIKNKGAIKALAKKYQLQTQQKWPIYSLSVDCVVFNVPSSKSVIELMGAIEKEPNVHAVQKLNDFSVRGSTYNDPYYSLQKNHRTTGVDVVHMYATGKDIKVAIVDTGVDYTHRDLRAPIKVRKNFVDRDNAAFKNERHGTAVAGVIGAEADNHYGIVGIAPGAQLYALKACWQMPIDQGTARCNSFTLARAIDYAIRQKVNILNLSLSGPSDLLLENLINEAVRKGIIIVGAYDSINYRNHAFPSFIKGVIAVDVEAYTDQSKINYISAPGVNILTTSPGSTYTIEHGSSLAAAHITGVVALIMELDPDLSNREIQSLLNNDVMLTDLPRLIGKTSAKHKKKFANVSY